MSLFMYYGEEFIALDYSNPVVKSYLQQIEQKRQLRQKLMQQLKQKEYESADEKMKLKWDVRLLEVQIRHLKGYVYIEG